MPEGTCRCIAAAEALTFMIAATEQARAYRLFDTRAADSYARGLLAHAERHLGRWIGRLPRAQPLLARLLTVGARPDNQNDNGATALMMYCASSGRDARGGLLLGAGADAGLCTLDDFRAVALAATTGSLRLLRHTARA